MHQAVHPPSIIDFSVAECVPALSFWSSVLPVPDVLLTKVFVDHFSLAQIIIFEPSCKLISICVPEHSLTFLPPVEKVSVVLIPIHRFQKRVPTELPIDVELPVVFVAGGQFQDSLLHPSEKHLALELLDFVKQGVGRITEYGANHSRTSHLIIFPQTLVHKLLDVARQIVADLTQELSWKLLVLESFLDLFVAKAYFYFATPMKVTHSKMSFVVEQVSSQSSILVKLILVKRPLVVE